MANPQDDEIVRQMKMLEDVDTDEVEIPQAPPAAAAQAASQPPSLDQMAQSAAERTGSDFISPEDAPEVFSALDSGGGGLQELIQLVRDLPRQIADELRSS